MFFTFFRLYKWYQIMQSVSYISNLTHIQQGSKYEIRSWPEISLRAKQTQNWAGGEQRSERSLLRNFLISKRHLHGLKTLYICLISTASLEILPFSFSWRTIMLRGNITKLFNIWCWVYIKSCENLKMYLFLYI